MCFSLLEPRVLTSACSACDLGDTCSSAKVTGFIIYETFSFLWTSQVIGNVALATLAGGPFGSQYTRIRP